MYIKNNLILFLLIFCLEGYSQNIVNINIGNGSIPLGSEVTLKLKHRFQHYNKSVINSEDTYDKSINSPKSVNILNAKNKFYIHSLEGYTTSVYSISDFVKIKEIKHIFGKENQYLFNDNETEDMSQEPSSVSENPHSIPVVEVDSKVEATTHKIMKASTSNDDDAVAITEESVAASTINETDDTMSELLVPDGNINSIQNIASESTGGDRNTRHVLTIKRGWLEKNLCEEFSDMMQCAKTRTVINHTSREIPKSMHRILIRRQVFTAIGVAAAMTLPKIAPHIFKINLAQVLSLSFWKSLMEFVTLLIQ